MIEQNEWISFKEIDWEDPLNNRFNIDTRDFHGGYFLSDEVHKDYATISKYPKFFFTKEEIINLLNRLYTESGEGGKDTWRMLELESIDNRVLNWNLKYLRIWRTDNGFIVCNSDNVAIPKPILNCKVNQKYLNMH